MGFTIQLDGAKDWAPHEGGGDRYPFEGYTIGVIEKIEESKSAAGNDTLVFTVQCSEPEAKGLRARKWIPVSGMRKDNKPNVLGLFEALGAIYSTSMSQDEALAKVRALEGRQIDSDKLITSLVGKTVAYEVEDEAYTKQDGSSAVGTSLKNFIMKGRYDDAKATNTHHRASSGGGAAPQPRQVAAPNPASAPNGATAGASAAKASSASKDAADLL